MEQATALVASANEVQYAKTHGVGTEPAACLQRLTGPPPPMTICYAPGRKEVFVIRPARLSRRRLIAEGRQDPDHAPDMGGEGLLHGGSGGRLAGSLTRVVAGG
jgi:hypothetical protein